MKRVIAFGFLLSWSQAGPAQPPPDTEIYLAPLKVANGTIDVGSPVNITNSPGYDNQPSFTPDGASVLFTSVRGALPASLGGSTTQSDIYRYDIRTREVTRVTETPESEYSPTTMPDGRGISVIRVEADGAQRLWSIRPSGPKIEAAVLLPDIKPVGYHAWADEHTLALFVLGQPATLQLADTRAGTARPIATDIGRSIQRIPGSGTVSDISFVQREREGDTTRLTIRRLNPTTGEVTTIAPAVAGSREADTAWTPDGTLLMAKDGTLYGWTRTQPSWKEIASAERLSLPGVTRLAVSPAGDYLAVVGSPRPPR
jgi:WD40 repeat protein